MIVTREMSIGARLTLVCALLAGCVRSGEQLTENGTGGTVVISAAADADALIPPLIAQSSGRQVADQIFDRLAEIGDDLNTTGDGSFRPVLADRWSWARDSLSLTFHLRTDARWHDGRPVTADDVRFTWELYADPQVASPSAPLLANIDSVTVHDATTVVFWFARRTPSQFFETTYPLLILPRHGLGTAARARLRESPFARHPIGTGRFRFSARDPGTSIEIVSDTLNYRGRAVLDRVVWTVAADFNTAAMRFMSREADVFEALRPEQLEEIERTRDLRALTLPSLDYAFVQFNTRDSRTPAVPHPVFGDPALRRALSMAVNRDAVVHNVFDTLAVSGIGPVSRGLGVTDTTVRPPSYDTAGAARLLDSLGWTRRNRQGLRTRAGRPLRFTLLVPSSSRNRVRMAVLLQEQLRPLGVQMNIEQLDYAAFVERSRQRRFDAVFGAWRIDVGPQGIRQTWGTAGSRSANGLNYGSYENAAFDAQIDSALTAGDPRSARIHFRRAQQIIVADAPAIWMYEPRITIGIHARLRPQRVRPDAWWAGLADWSVDPSMRLPRDRMGITAGGR
jgi:peptide/nickel transport system substrate-binding protein